MEKIVRVIETRSLPNGMEIKVVESIGDFGKHFLLLIDGEPGFHSTDLERVLRYMRDF